MESVEAEGNSIDEAIDSALKTLGTTPQVTTATQVTAGTKATQNASNLITSDSKSANALSVKGTQYLASAQQWAKQHTC